jgi:hypothetical protein
MRILSVLLMAVLFIAGIPTWAAAKTVVDEPKLAIARSLTDSVQKLLQQRRAVVAVVSRMGGQDAKRHDFTGMAHSGIAAYDPRAQSWIVYSLQNEMTSGFPHATIWRTALLDFFYAQTGYGKRSLVLIPDNTTQQRIYRLFSTATTSDFL